MLTALQTNWFPVCVHANQTGTITSIWETKTEGRKAGGMSILCEGRNNHLALRQQRYMHGEDEAKAKADEQKIKY